MRILHTLPGRNWGGLEQRTLDQVQWLDQHGHQAWLATPKDGQSFLRAQGLGLSVIAMDFDRPWGPTAILKLRHVVRSLGIEVIDTHVTRDAKAAILCRDLCAVVRTRHVAHRLSTSWLRQMQWQHGSDHVIAVAHTIRDHLIAQKLALPERISMVGEWVEEQFFQFDAPLRHGTRAALGLAAGVPVILCVGMLRPDKGQDVLLQAMTRIPDAICLLCGEATAEGTDYAAGLHDRALSADLNGRIRFLGYRTDLPALLAAADLVVLPSRLEAQSRVACEALAAARPVIASDVGGIPEVIEHDVTGWLVPPNDPAILAQTITAVLHTPPDRLKAITAAGRHKAESSLRLEHCMAQTVTAYERALAWAAQR